MEFSAKNLIADPTICGWEATNYSLFSANITDSLIYYSHFFPLLTILFLSGYVFQKNPKGLSNRILLVLGIVFAGWIMLGLMVWASGNADQLMFLWSVLTHFDLLLYVVTFYFGYAFFKNKMPSWRIDLFFLLLFIPLILFTHTSFNLTGFDFTNCWREAFEGPLWQWYIYPIEIGITFWLLFFGLYHIKKQPKEVQKQDFIALLALIGFLISFAAGNIIGTIGGNWELGEYGRLGMSLFVSILTYLILKYKSFHVDSLLAEILAIWFTILIGSLLFIEDLQMIKVIVMITLALALVLRLVLVTGARRDIKQRTEIQLLAQNLQGANKRLKVLDKMKSEFISIASHQLRGPIASIRGHASMLTEGSYGVFPKKAEEVLERIAESAKFMALMVDDYLNVSRIEAGSMKYDRVDFNLKETAEKIVAELLPIALQKGLLMVFRSDCTGNCVIHADIGKTRQIIMNLIENSMEFTPKGSITVSLQEFGAKRKLRLIIEDTGVGMSKEVVEGLFDKFVRAKSASKINVTGTGLGLYIARKMIIEMGGRIWAESEGEGKGSTFTVEFPFLPSKSKQ